MVCFFLPRAVEGGGNLNPFFFFFLRIAAARRVRRAARPHLVRRLRVSVRAPKIPTRRRDARLDAFGGCAMQWAARCQCLECYGMQTGLGAAIAVTRDSGLPFRADSRPATHTRPRWRHGAGCPAGDARDGGPWRDCIWLRQRDNLRAHPPAPPPRHSTSTPAIMSDKPVLLSPPPRFLSVTGKPLPALEGAPDVLGSLHEPSPQNAQG